ncbi:metallophosphoesterase [Halomicrobium sp. IBSBa]|uniref:metallophosphoesterase family protein n=1 Tax=Halomicrobium sp. IBSBa TaxID=2778916 RepID=UPI001ABF8CDC|nr:metallophosphoesterase [Halomicrobium sp. IBSBa]MBO4247140.1 metallophosphoesterase [Halomicrobium sp. IBSBa]
MTTFDDAGPVVARLDEPRGDHTRFAVLADPHVSTREEGTSKLFEHTLDHLEAAVADIGRRDVDAVLSPGDLTKDGEPWNYDAVDRALSELDVPFYAVPGNHDVPKTRDEHDPLSVDGFADRYGPGELPYHVEVGSLDVIGLNTAGTADRLYESHEGRVTEATLDWLGETLAEAETPVVLLHHNLPSVSDQIDAHREIESEMVEIPAMVDADPLAETLADGGAQLLLSGHYHLPATGEYRGLREIAAPTTCSFPQSYLLCETTPAGTTIRLVPITDVVGLETAHARRTDDSATAKGLTAIAAARLASFPLVTE